MASHHVIILRKANSTAIRVTVDWAKSRKLTRILRLLVVVVVVVVVVVTLAVERVLVSSSCWFLTDRLCFKFFLLLFLIRIFINSSKFPLSLLLLLCCCCHSFIDSVFFIFMLHLLFLIALFSDRFISLSALITVYDNLLIYLIYEFYLLFLLFWHCF